jgi:LysM repeat protein
MSNTLKSVFSKLFAGKTGNIASISVKDFKVEGDVNGNIVIGHGNRILQYVVNRIYGTVINYHTRPAVKLRDLKPQPPRLPQTFIGRVNELSALEKHIKARSAVLLHGHGGIGKTTLIRQAANSDSAIAMPDGVLILEGAEEQSQSVGFEDVLQKLFDALYESDPHLKVDSIVARTYLSNTKPLVLIDRFDISTRYLRTLPDFFPKGAVVVTSQNALSIEVFESIGLLSLSHNDSIQLLSIKSEIDQNTHSSPLMDEICAILADVPLAVITIANAIREKRITLPDAASRLKQLQPPSQDRTQAAIERSFALVYSVLNKEERETLLIAAAASGISIDRDVLESIASEESTKSLESLELLQANSPRLRLPDGYRQIILSASKNTSLFREKILDRLTKQLKSRALDFDFISNELGNLLGLIRWAESEKRWSDIITLGKAIDPYLTLHGLWDAWQVVLQQILSAADQLSDTATRAWALHQLGTREGGVGNLSQAKGLLEQALVSRKSIGDKIGAAYTQHNLWVLFPPPFGRRGQGPDTPPTPLPLNWVLLTLVAVAIIIAIAIWQSSWETYRNIKYGFEFMYPAKGILTEYPASEPFVGGIELLTNPNDLYDKKLEIVANQGREENRCEIPVDRENWIVESVTLNDTQFLKATKKIIDLEETGYMVYATSRDPDIWVCLIFSYSPWKSNPDQPTITLSDTQMLSETNIFGEIASTFRWVISTTATLTPTKGTIIPTTVSITVTNTNTPTSTDTLTQTSTPTSTLTLTPTGTSTFTPTFSPTSCSFPTNWAIYIVQSGDTLFNISLWYSDINLTVEDLQKANCKDTSTRIFEGERLFVPRVAPPATITGYVFLDPNRNDRQDEDEKRLAGVAVTITNASGVIVGTTITNENGEFEFSNLTYGLYYVFQYPINLRPGQIAEQNFGVVPVP